MTSPNCSSVVSTTERSRPTAALFTRTSMCPKRSSALSTAVATAPGSLTSAGTKIDLRPAPRQPLEQRTPFGGGTLAADDGGALVDETLDDRAADAAATTSYDRYFPGQPGGRERGRRSGARATGSTHNLG